MVGHGGSSAGSYLADPTSPIPSHSASIVATGTLRVKDCAVSMTHYIESSYTVLQLRITYNVTEERVRIILTLTVLVATIDALGHF